jgi:hypothetical protein
MRSSIRLPARNALRPAYRELARRLAATLDAPSRAVRHAAARVLVRVPMPVAPKCSPCANASGWTWSSTNRSRPNPPTRIALAATC